MGRPTKSLSYHAAERVLRPAMSLVTRHDWRGAEHLPQGVGYLVVVNHLSHADPLTLAHFLVRHGSTPRFMAKAGVFRIPVVGPVLRRAGQIPVHRRSTDAARAYSSAVQAIGQGEAVVIYPEGTLTRDPDLWPMRGKTGAARIARETGCLVVPVVQWGPQQLLAPYGSVPHLLPRPRVVLQVRPPVELSWPGVDATGAEEAAALEVATETIMSTLTDMLAELRGAPAPGTRWDPRRHGQPATGNPASRRRR